MPLVSIGSYWNALAIYRRDGGYSENFDMMTPALFCAPPFAKCGILQRITMRLARVQHLLIASLTRSALCFPPSRDAVSAANSHLDIKNLIAPVSPLPDANNSGLSNDSLAVGPLLPHRFRVPTTHTVLYLGFGIIRNRIDWNELQSLLMIAKGAVQEGIDHHSIDTMYPRSPINGLQSFAQLGVGIEIVVRNLNHDHSLFTWGQLYDVVEGLRLYLVEERRNYEAAFRFYEDPAEDVEQSRIALGYGRIQTVRAADGVAEG
ncbi:MAG: hypothetical protein Q9195_005167 [Heterodermia aff. obscurata]